MTLNKWLCERQLLSMINKSYAVISQIGARGEIFARCRFQEISDPDLIETEKRLCYLSSSIRL